MGADALTKRVGMSRNNLFKSLRRLQDLGLLVVESGWSLNGFNRPNIYHFPVKVKKKKQGPGLIQSPAPSKQVFVDKPGSSTAEAIARLKSKLT